MFWIIAWPLFSLSWIAFLASQGLSEVYFGLGVLIEIPLTLLFVYGLASKDWFFTFIEEGTAKIIVRGNEFDKILIAWENHYLDKKTLEVKKGKSRKHFLGGLRFYGVPPFQKILVYHFRWSHLHEDGNIKEHDEWIDYILLKTDVYVVTLSPLLEESKGAEKKDESVQAAGGKTLEATEDITGIPLNISIALPMKVVNPYKAIFDIRRWVQIITAVVEVKFRRFVAKFRYKEDLLNMLAGEDIEKIQKNAGIAHPTKPGTDLWKEFWEELKSAFKDEGGEVKNSGNIEIYGVEIEEKKAGVLKINPSAKYRELSTLKYETERKAEQVKITAEAEGKAISERVKKPTWEIAKDLAGVKKKDSGLSQEEIKKISNYLEEAWSNYLEDTAIRAIKETDKIIVTEGKGIGRTVGRDTAREMIRKRISRERKEEEAEKKE